MSMGERHEHMKTPSAYEGVSGVNLRFLRLLQLWLLLPFVLPFSRSSILASFCGLVPRFASLYVRHLLGIVVLCLERLALSKQSLAFGRKSRMSMGESHELGRTTFAYEYPMYIWGTLAP